MQFFGAQNVGSSWHPPPLEGQLLAYYNTVAREGLGKLGDMIGGAVAGALMKNPKTGKPGGLRGALGGMLLGANPEVRRKNEEWKALQSYAEAAYGLGKDVTNPLSIDELRGWLRGMEARQMEQERMTRLQTEQERLEATREYYRNLKEAQVQAQYFKELESERYAKGQEVMSKWLKQHPGDISGAIGAAMAQAPGSVPFDLLKLYLSAQPKTGETGEPSIGEIGSSYLALFPGGNKAPEVLINKDVDFARQNYMNAVEALNKAIISSLGLGLPSSMVQPQIEELRKQVDHWKGVLKSLNAWKDVPEEEQNQTQQNQTQRWPSNYRVRVIP